MDRRAGVVYRGGRHDRHLLERVQRAAGGRPPSARAEGDRHAVLHRRPLCRRCALRRRLRGLGHAAVGVVDARVERVAARPGHRRRALAGDVARAVGGGAPVHRALARPSAPRRLLEAGLGVRGLRENRGRRLRRRRLVGWLHERHPAAPRGPARTAQGADRAVGARLAAGRPARADDRVPAGDAALVRPLARRCRHGDHGRTDAAGLHPGLVPACQLLCRAAGVVGGGAGLARARREPAAPAPEPGRPGGAPCRGGRAALLGGADGGPRRRLVVSVRSPPTGPATSGRWTG